MQALAMDFLQPLREGGKDLIGNLRSAFNIEGGPLALNKLWMSMVQDRVKWRIRQTQAHHREKPFYHKETEEGEALDPVDQIPDTRETDHRNLDQIYKDMSTYVRSRLHNPKFVSIFNKWLEIAFEKGPDRVDMKKDVYAPLVAEGLDTGYSSFYEQWLHNIRPLMKSFLQKEQIGRISADVRSKLKVSSVEIIAYEEYRRRLSSWILGAIFRANIEKDE
jgi:hypothetical protein